MDDEESGPSPERKIVDGARKKFARCERFEATARRRYQEDIKFANGDARNGYQWPREQRTSRDADSKPCFTINKTRQHNLQIINDARQNKQAVTIKPVGDGASYDSAQIFQGLIRHIEYRSNAQNVYTTAVRTQVQGGIGYWRVVTDYADADSFDQEAFIRRVKDPMSVYMDPNCNEADRSDANFAFIFDSVPRDQAEADWPRLKAHLSECVIGESDTGWIDEDNIRVAEYFQREKVADELAAVTANGQRIVKRLTQFTAQDMQTLTGQDIPVDEIKPAQLRKLLAAMGGQFRPVTSHVVKWYKIAGDMIVDEREWPGSIIPIIMLIGEETVIEGEMDRKGHTRALIDPQMNYNYWASEAATQVALQSKSPYIADVEAIDGYQQYWDTANTKNWPYLPYHSRGTNGEVYEKPERQQPPVLAQAYIQGMTFAAEEMRMVSGQYQASIGAPGNETSGIAIQQRQRQADNATYHYVDHLGNAIRLTGRILLEIIPKVYDTDRVISIMAEDGEVTQAMLDPAAAQAHAQQEVAEGMEARAIFNPNVGRYSVDSDVGPSFATQRQEAFNAISQIVQQNQHLAGIVGDLLFKAADFPLAQEIAERLRRMVPAQALGDRPTPQMQQLMQQNQQLQQMIEALSQKLVEAKSKSGNDDDKTIVDAYRAETDRIDVLKDVIFSDPRMALLLATKTTHEAAGLDPNSIVVPAAARSAQRPQPPSPAPQQPSPHQPPPGGFSMPGAPQQ